MFLALRRDRAPRLPGLVGLGLPGLAEAAAIPAPTIEEIGMILTFS